MKHLTTVTFISIAVGLIAVLALTQRCEVIDGNIHVTSRSFISAWNKESKLWEPLIRSNFSLADSAIIAKIKSDLDSIGRVKTSEDHYRKLDSTRRANGSAEYLKIERRLITTYNTLENPKTTYNEFMTWVSLMLQNSREYTLQEIDSKMIPPKNNN